MGMSGRMDNLVIVESLKSDTEDAYNGTDYEDADNWQTYCSRWAEIVPQGGREFRFAKQEQADLALMLRMHSDAVTRAIHPRMRIKYESRVFQISSAYDKDGRRQLVEIKCTEVV